MCKHLPFDPKPRASTQPVTRVLQREYAASEHRVTEQQISSHIESLRASPILHAHTTHLLFSLSFYSMHLRFLGTTPSTSCFSCALYFRTTDPHFCLPELNSLLRHRQRITFRWYCGCAHNHVCPVDSDATAIIPMSMANNWITSAIPDRHVSGLVPLAYTAPRAHIFSSQIGHHSMFNSVNSARWSLVWCGVYTPGFSPSV
jgi:hypothetical protein